MLLHRTGFNEVRQDDYNDLISLSFYNFQYSIIIANFLPLETETLRLIWICNFPVTKNIFLGNYVSLGGKTIDDQQVNK